jgi:hypothetical protein
MNPIKNAYIEGWNDRNAIEYPLEANVSTSIEKDWLKSNSSAFLDLVEDRWECRHDRQLLRIRELEEVVRRCLSGKET